MYLYSLILYEKTLLMLVDTGLVVYFCKTLCPKSLLNGENHLDKIKYGQSHRRG